MKKTQVFQVEAPNGITYPVEGPADATDEELVAAVVRQFPEASKPQQQGVARQTGANLPPVVQGAMTGLSGATMGFLDELAGAANVAGQAGSYAGAGFANQPTPRLRPEQAYQTGRDVVRGATTQFGQDYPNAAPALEVGGALSTIPLTMGGSAVPAGANLMYRGYRALRPMAGQSALGAAGQSEAEDTGQLAEDITRGTLEGTMFGGGLALGGKTLGVLGRHVGPRLPVVGERFEQTPARERLAQILQRDMEARILTGEADPITIAQSRLEKLGPEAPIAATGRSATGELGLLKNMPGSAETLTGREARRIAQQRGPALVTSAEEALDAGGVPFRATVQEFSQQAKEKAAPFYQQLRTADFDVDDELANIISRARKAYGEAEELAAVSGMPQRLDLGKVQPGDRVPFDVLDNLKRTLYDIEEAAKGEFGKPTNKSRAYTNLRRDLIRKLDELSPKDKSGQSIYKQARTAFEGEAQLETAMRRGREALTDDVEELQEIINDLDPSQLEAFRLGAAQALRDMAGTQSGQTRLLNMYKEPKLQARLRSVFGNDFRKFQRAVLQQEELKRVEQAGQGSQSFKLLAGAEDQSQMMDMLDAAQAAQQGGLPLTRRVAQGFSNLRMPEASRNQLARMLLLRGEPAQEELRNMRAYMERRRKQQQLAGQLAGRTGAVSASTTPPTK